MQEIDIVIEPNGDVTVEGKGIVGPECETLTKEIEQALGSVQKRVKKPEYHRTATNTRKAGA